MLEFLEELADDRPLLLLGENVEDADPTTLELLALAIDRCRATRILIVLTHPPTWEPPWDPALYRSLQLGPLGVVETRALVDSARGG